MPKSLSIPAFKDLALYRSVVPYIHVSVKVPLWRSVEINISRSPMKMLNCIAPNTNLPELPQVSSIQWLFLTDK